MRPSSHRHLSSAFKSTDKFAPIPGKGHTVKNESTDKNSVDTFIPDPVADFNRMQDIWLQNTSELDTFIKILEKRKKIEAHFVAQLASLQKEVQQLASPVQNISEVDEDNEEKISKSVWNAFRQGLNFEHDFHMRHVRFIEDSLLSQLKKELDFERSTSAIIFRDVHTGFVQYEAKKAFALEAWSIYYDVNARRQMTQKDAPSHVLPLKHSTSEIVMANFEKTRSIQAQLMEAAFLRMSEIESRRLSFLFSGVFQLYSHLQESYHEDADYLSKNVLEGFPTQLDIHQMLSDELNCWLQVYSLPMPLPPPL